MRLVGYDKGALPQQQQQQQQQPAPPPVGRTPWDLAHAVWLEAPWLFVLLIGGGLAAWVKLWSRRVSQR